MVTEDQMATLSEMLAGLVLRILKVEDGEAE